MEIVKKVWGFEEIYCNELYCFKRLQLDPGFICSYHGHEKKDESFLVGPTSAPMYMCMREVEFKLFAGNFIHVPPGYYHQFAAMTEKGAYFYEVSTHDAPEDSYRQSQSGTIDKSVFTYWSTLPAFSELVQQGLFNEYGDLLFPGGA